MRQFILPEDWNGAPACRIEGGRARYLLRVLRLGVGDRFPGLDAGGRRFSCEVLEIGPARLVLGVGARLEPEAGTGPLPDTRAGRDSERPIVPGGERRAEAVSASSGAESKRLPSLTLVPALLKGEKMDLVLRQAAEAGVGKIQPLITRRSVGDPGAQKFARWNRIVREALQQSGSPVSTNLDPVLPLGEFLRGRSCSPERRLDLVFHEAPLVETGLHEYLTEALDELVICVGPEGGFAPEELAGFESAGFRFFKLPGAVLRAETAALYAVAAAEIILAERSSWILTSR